MSTDIDFSLYMHQDVPTLVYVTYFYIIYRSTL